MSKVLLIDGCARGWEISKTYALAEHFMDNYRMKNHKDEFEEVHLTEEKITCFGGAEIERREELLAVGALIDDAFSLARQFAQADKIVVAAPFWDMSFPALLKAYIETVSVRGITFGYNDKGQIGLCKAEKLLYITTSGGDYKIDSDDANVLAYWRSLCNMYGIKGFDYLWVQGLDIVENDSEKLLADGFAQAKELSKSW